MSDIRWPGASFRRATGGRGLLASLVVHGGLTAVVAAALTVGAPERTADVVETVWIETPTTQAARAEAAEPAAEPPPAAPVTAPPERSVPPSFEREPVATQAEREPIPGEVVEPPPARPVPVAALALPRPASPQPAPPRPASPQPAPPRPAPPRPPPAVRGLGPSPDTMERAGPTQLAAASAQPAPVVSPSWSAELAAWLYRNKTYPAAARSRGEQGSGQVRFTVARDGRVLAVELVNTTGSSSLDEAVRRLLDGARVPAFPADMPHAEVTVNIRISYALSQGASSP